MTSTLKKIAVDQLTVGMFIHGFEAGWLDHPFWRGRFLLGDPSRIHEIQASGMQQCWIDVSKGLDVPVPAPHEAAITTSASSPPRSRP